MRVIISVIVFSLFFIGCKKNKRYVPLVLEEGKMPKIDSVLEATKPIKNWQLKDIFLDKTPGISMQRAYDSIMKFKKGETVIVAVLDSEIDIKNKSLEKFIWRNSKEIPGNNIDDDDNGYIDDVNGWNFLGNKNGTNTNFTSYSYTRVVKKYDSIFKGKNIEEIEKKDSLSFLSYTKAKKTYEDQLAYANEDINYINMVSKGKTEAEEKIAEYLKQEEYSIESLDSLKVKYPLDTGLHKMINRKSNFIRYGYSHNYIKVYKLKALERLDKLLNIEFNERRVVGDNPEDISDKDYGNNLVNGNVNLFTHGTEVSSAIIGLKSNNIKIMPVVISPFGDENDKDIALAIRYAVDNGARVINMSFGKSFSIHREWVSQAFKYAEKNNVILITAAGNSSENLNLVGTKYPNDMLEDGTELSDNFLSVGAVSNSLNEGLLSYFSDYGDNYVDVFAPGDDIFTGLPNNKYNFNGGTSLSSAITSGVAALIYSYYPTLNASQVKHVIMDSGLEYNLKVKTPTENDKNNMTLFNQLSKSGKVVNVYNALIMADSISKN
ncbi:S8 family serine peptidase [Tenacibaculum sp.]|nr:S8 family serine peptidase [Tenacibaculum sp.]